MIFRNNRPAICGIGLETRHKMPWSRESRHSRGYGTAWNKLRLHILERDKHLCQPCLAKNRVSPARQVDHITPKANGGTDDETNLQAICDPCHKAKTARDNGQTPRPQIGTDGWPIES